MTGFRRSLSGTNNSTNTFLFQCIGAATMAPLLIATSAAAQDRDPFLFYDQNGTKVRGHLQAGINFPVESNLYWNLPQAITPGLDFGPDTS